MFHSINCCIYVTTCACHVCSSQAWKPAIQSEVTLCTKHHAFIVTPGIVFCRIHNKPYMGSYNSLEAAGRCMDLDPKCKAMAAAGDCENKPDFMTGPAGHCRKSCNDCEDCAAGDLLCYRRNMRSRAAQRRKLSGGGKGGAPRT